MVASFAMQSSMSAIGLADMSGRVIFVNDSWLKLWGYDRVEEVLGRPISEFSSAGEESEAIQALLSGRGYVGEGIAVSKDGTSFDVQFAINNVRSPDDKPVCMMASFIDISDRKSAEARLKESEERYRFLFDSISDAIFVHPLDGEGLPGRFIEVNAAACALLGWDREELVRMTPADISLPEERDSIPAAMKRLRVEKREVWEGMHVTKDGRQISVEVSHHVFDFRGRPTALSAVRDITERKKSEAALRESEAKFRSYIECSPLAVFVADQRGASSMSIVLPSSSWALMRRHYYACISGISIRRRIAKTCSPISPPSFGRDISRSSLASREATAPEYGSLFTQP